ncbi:fumarate hydratase, mitochondrial-like [Agrilus planipennis]|uniref:fumarate hydratase n=1 Tax=Agrilus planipennis TaxID=224129 RepID=A0A1W4WZE9_AGRPL|nr:fumarate hydratase, mitochondrial-like [Agrilus planipennis]
MCNSSAQYRVESDSLGELQVPADKLYGVQTQRCLIFFPIGGEFERQPFALVIAIAVVKKACAEVNAEFGLDPSIARAISQACDEVISGELYADHFPVPIWQSGAGTASNMNANEVICNRAIEILGGKVGTKTPVHPLDHVNMGQSTNDIIPSSMNIAVAHEINKSLLPSLNKIKSSLNAKAEEFSKIIKVGRTHVQDAVPLTLGQEFSGYVEQLNTGINQIKAALPRLYLLNIGGTAIGTGINQYQNFDKKCVAKIAEFTGLPFQVTPNKFEATAASDCMVLISGVLNHVATSLTKISNDIRFMSSGPRCGIGEISLPENEPGSSIMPGKINPTHCDSMGAVCAQVMGNHVAITIACSNGHFELNVFRIMIVSNVLQSVRLLGDSCLCTAKFCIDGIKANIPTIEKHLTNCLMLVTALNPHIGYDRSSKIALYAHHEGLTLREAAEKMGISKQQFDEWVKPELMIQPQPYKPKGGSCINSR